MSDWRPPPACSPSSATQERSETTIPQYDRAIGLLTRLVQEEPENPSYGFELAQAHHNAATNEGDLGHRELAESHFLKAIEFATASAGWSAAGKPRRSTQSGHAASQPGGHTPGPNGSVRCAQDHYTECRRLLLELLKAEPENVDAAFQLGDILSQWAISLSYSETTARRAEELFQEGIQWLEPIVRREPKLALARSSARQRPWRTGAVAGARGPLRRGGPRLGTSGRAVRTRAEGPLSVPSRDCAAPRRATTVGRCGSSRN